ncbi:MAG: peptidoglycan editing factor PgeF [Alcanivoracaceae bacterium]
MTLPAAEQWLTPDWQPHPRVRVCVTRRRGDFSPPPWAGFNLGSNCEDDPERVARARAHVQRSLTLGHPPHWLTQVHGIRIVRFGDADRRADGVWTDQPEQACVVLTADCLPVLIARQDGSAVGAFHAGWRGLLDGILEAGVQQLAPQQQALSVWIGPAICQRCYQVGDEVRQRFLAHDPAASTAFREDGASHWRMDLVALARQRWAAAGVTGVTGGDLCTACLPGDYYSFRREGQTGRFASLIWLKD